MVYIAQERKEDRGRIISPPHARTRGWKMRMKAREEREKEEREGRETVCVSS